MCHLQHSQKDTHSKMQCICSYWYNMQHMQMYSLALQKGRECAVCLDRNKWWLDLTINNLHGVFTTQRHFEFIVTHIQTSHTLLTHRASMCIHTPLIKCFVEKACSTSFSGELNLKKSFHIYYVWCVWNLNGLNQHLFPLLCFKIFTIGNET